MAVGAYGWFGGLGSGIRVRLSGIRLWIRVPVFRFRVWRIWRVRLGRISVVGGWLGALGRLGTRRLGARGLGKSYGIRQPLDQPEREHHSDHECHPQWAYDDDGAEQSQRSMSINRSAGGAQRAGSPPSSHAFGNPFGRNTTANRSTTNRSGTGAGQAGQIHRASTMSSGSNGWRTASNAGNSARDEPRRVDRSEVGAGSEGGAGTGSGGRGSIAGPAGEGFGRHFERRSGRECPGRWKHDGTRRDGKRGDGPHGLGGTGGRRAWKPRDGWFRDGRNGHASRAGWDADGGLWWISRVEPGRVVAGRKWIPRWNGRFQWRNGRFQRRNGRIPGRRIRRRAWWWRRRTPLSDG